MGTRWQEVAQSVLAAPQQAMEKLRDVTQAVGHHLQHLQDSHQRRAVSQPLATLSLGRVGRSALADAQLAGSATGSSSSLARSSGAGAGGSTGAAPVAELAFNPVDVKARLAGVPVYAVTNQDSEFVLVQGEGDSGGRQLGLFFFNEADARALVAKVREANPALGKAAQVVAVGMDKVYEFALLPRDVSGAQGVLFRFMPDAEQVRQALQLYAEAGIPVSSFTGVPVFQVEGLTVKGEAGRYTPLFLAMPDLRAALSGAYSAKQLQKGAATQAKFTRASSERDAARAAVEAAGSRGDKKAAQAELTRAQARVDKYAARLGEGVAPPKLEVGCLEEVIARMEQDKAGDWGDVLLVPAGALSSPAALAAQQQQEQQQQQPGGSPPAQSRK